MFEKIDTDHQHPSRRSTLHASQMVSTSQPLAAQAGLQILQAGGNAVDAAIATAICLTVVEPTMNSIGGDAFAIIADESGVHGFNGCGRSPQGWTVERFADYDRAPEHGWDSVTVPGAVDTWVQVWRRFGTLPFAKLFESAVSYARHGYPVSPVLAQDWSRDIRLFEHQDGFRDTFTLDGRAPHEGERFRCPAMADSLSEIAASTGESFYRGALAQQIVADGHRHGGVMNADDLAQHEGFWTDCLSQDFAGLTVHEIPPNGQGIVTLIALGILEHLDIARYDALSLDSVHLQIEAIKTAFYIAHRHVADPDAMAISTDAMLDADLLARCASKIRLDRASTPKVTLKPDKGTVYLATADAGGMMVSWIQSHYSNFGSGMVVPGTGINMHNRGAGFVLESGHPNQIGGGKRPYHTIIPAFVTRAQQPHMALGVMGAHHQPQGQTQVLNHLVHHGLSPQQALDAPRWHVREDFTVTLESGLTNLSVLLAERGHHLVEHDRPGLFGGGQVIMRTEGGYAAGSDPRKDGQAVGF